MNDIDTAIDGNLTLEKVLSLESEMMKMDQVDLPVKHHFSSGVYARELHIPAGVTLTGKIHKFTNMNMLIKGELSVSTENGIQRVHAPFLIVSPAGTKRVAYAHQDSIWVTIHGTNETDIEKIENQFVAGSHADYLAHCEKLKLGGQ